MDIETLNDRPEETVNPELKITATEVTPARQRNRRSQHNPFQQQPTQPEVVDRKDLTYQWKKGKELVRGRFVNDETPGEMKGFAFRKFKQDPIKVYKLKDQGIYEIPLSVAQHLNEDGKLPIYGLEKDEEGNMVETVVGYKKRFHFESLEFSGIGE